MSSFKLHKNSRRIRGTIFHAPDLTSRHGIFMDMFPLLLPRRSRLKYFQLVGRDSLRYDLAAYVEAHGSFPMSYSWKTYQLSNHKMMLNRTTPFMGYIRFRDR